MLGFIIGAVCAVAVIKVLRRRHGHYGHCGYGGFDHAGGYAGNPVDLGRRSSRGRWFMRGMFERLQTTPGQEKVILGAFDELRQEKAHVRDELKQARADFARAVRSGVVDDAALEETFARQDRLLARLRVSFVEALKKVSEALDERQRSELGDLLERGLFGRGPRWGADPYRTWL